MKIDQSLEDIAQNIGDTIYKRQHGAWSESSKTITPSTNKQMRGIHGFQNAVRLSALMPNLLDFYKAHHADFPPDIQSAISSVTPEEMKALQVVALMRASGRSNPPINPPPNDPDKGSGRHYAERGVAMCEQKLKALGLTDSEAKKYAQLIKDCEGSPNDLLATDPKMALFASMLSDGGTLETMRDRLDTGNGKGKTVDANWFGYHKLSKEGADGKALDEAFYTEMVQPHRQLIQDQQGWIGTGYKIGDDVKVQPSAVQQANSSQQVATENDPKLFSHTTDAMKSRYNQGAKPVVTPPKSSTPKKSSPPDSKHFAKPSDLPVFVANSQSKGMFSADFGGADIMVNAASVDGLQPNQWGGLAKGFNSAMSANPEGKAMMEADWKSGKHEPGAARIVRGEGGRIANTPMGNPPSGGKYVVHAYSPDAGKEKNPDNIEKQLFQAYYNAMLRGAEIVEAEGPPKTIGVPPLGIGVYQVDIAKSAELAAHAMQEFYERHPEYKDSLQVKVPIHSANDEDFSSKFSAALAKPKPDLNDNLKGVVEQSEKVHASNKQRDASLGAAKGPMLTSQQAQQKATKLSGFELYMGGLTKQMQSNPNFASTSPGKTKKGKNKVIINKKGPVPNSPVPSLKITEKEQNINIKSAGPNPDKTDIELMVDSIAASGDKKPKINSGKPEDMKALYDGLVAKGLQPEFSDAAKQRFKDSGVEVPKPPEKMQVRAQSPKNN